MFDESSFTALKADVKSLLASPTHTSAPPLSRTLPVPEPLDLDTIMLIPQRLESAVTRYTNGLREYLVGEAWYPSMTSILAPVKRFAFKNWDERIGSRKEEVLEETSRIGLLVHYQFLEYMRTYLMDPEARERCWQNPPEFVYDPKIFTKGMRTEYMEYLKHAAFLFKQFLDIYGNYIKVLDIEHAVSNSRLQYAGRFDLQFKLYNQANQQWINCIGDIKTAKENYSSTGVQLTGYAMSDQLAGWVERLYELRFHPYPDAQYDYGWEFTQLKYNPTRLEQTVAAFYSGQMLQEPEEDDDDA